MEKIYSPLGEKHICTLPVTETLRERKTCYQKCIGFITDMMLISEKNPRAMLYFRSYTAIRDEKRKQMSYKYHVIHPFSEFRRYFEYLMTSIFLVHLILTPWDMFCDAMYAEELEVGSQIHLSLAFLSNLVDVTATFYTGYQDSRTDEVVIEVKMIRQHYLRSWLFLFDIVSTVPLELVIAHLPYTHAYHIRWINILSIIRLCRLPTTIIYMNNIADLWQVNPALYRSLRYIVYSVLILHWTTCVCVCVSKYFYIYNLDRTQQNWASHVTIRPGSNKLLVYVNAMFRTASQLMGVTHGIYPNLTMEDKLMTVGIFMTGYILMGFLLILTLQLMMSQSGPQLMNLAFLNQLQMYMSRIRLPRKKQEKLITYYKYLFRENSFYDSETLKLLSEQLRIEIIMHTYRNLIKNITIMAEFSQESIDMMLKYLRREIYMPGDYVMKAGSDGNCMYFIVNGTVAVTTASGIEVCHLHDGAYFGEVALILERNRRLTNVMALEISEICRLDRKHFMMCVQPNSTAYKRLMEQALNRQKHLDQLSKIHFDVLSRKSMSLTPSPFSAFRTQQSVKSIQSYAQSF